MQLPPDEEIVMVAGVAPIRVRKARYYEDRRFTERLLPEPAPSRAPPEQSATDDWSIGAPIAVPAEQPPRPARVKRAPKARPSTVGDRGDEPEVGSAATADPANAGIRREPGLPVQEEIVAKMKPPLNEFDFDDGDEQVEGAGARHLRDRFGQVARQASMDPKDGIEL